MIFTFDKTDSGIFGKAFEMAVKHALNRKHPDRVSPAGREDFIYNKKHYDIKQNGTVLKYSNFDGYIRGSSRVIYASHIDYTITAETATTISIAVNLAATEMFVVDRKDFLDFLAENGLMKINASRGTVNVQTGYNYKKAQYHGRAGKRIEAWAKDNEIADDFIITDILDGE